MNQSSHATFPRRGEVWIVSFDPTLGAEIRKTRPALILQNNIANEYSPVIIVAAITSKFDEHLYPTEVLIQPNEGGLDKYSVVQLSQIRSMNKQRLVNRLETLSEETMLSVEKALKISLGLIET